MVRIEVHWYSRIYLKRTSSLQKCVLLRYLLYLQRLLFYKIFNLFLVRIFTVFEHSLLNNRVLHKETWILSTLRRIQDHRVTFSGRDISSIAVKGPTQSICSKDNCLFIQFRPGLFLHRIVYGLDRQIHL